MEKPSAASNYIIRPLAKAWIPIVHLIHRRTVLVLAFLFAVGVLILLWQQYMLQSRLVESALLHDAARYSRVITEFRTLYTEKVVEVVRLHGIEITHDTEGKKNAIPLPLSFSVIRLPNSMLNVTGRGMAFSFPSVSCVTSIPCGLTTSTTLAV